MTLTKEQKIRRMEDAGYKVLAKTKEGAKTAFMALRWDKNYKANTITDLFRQIFGY